MLTRSTPIFLRGDPGWIGLDWKGRSRWRPVIVILALDYCMFFTFAPLTTSINLLILHLNTSKQSKCQ